MVNSQPQSWSGTSRGVKLGDSFSPFFFTLVVDVISRMILRGENRGLVAGSVVRGAPGAWGAWGSRQVTPDLLGRG